MSGWKEIEQNIQLQLNWRQCKISEILCTAEQKKKISVTKQTKKERSDSIPLQAHRNERNFYIQFKQLSGARLFSIILKRSTAWGGFQPGTSPDSENNQFHVHCWVRDKINDNFVKILFVRGRCRLPLRVILSRNGWATARQSITGRQFAEPRLKWNSLGRWPHFLYNQE